MNNKIPPTVDIIMVTYNHEKYISQAIESVLIQKTNFPVRLIIGEDCSTDNTRRICIKYADEYPQLIKLILHETNQGLLKNYKSIFDICTAKYLAILEGDDYWNYEYKLQKQVDILEKENQIGLVFAKANHINSNGNIIKRNDNNLFTKDYQKKYKETILFRSFIPALTVCFRYNLFIKHIDLEEVIKNKFATIDYPMWIQLSKITKFYFINEIMAAYRIHPESISNTKNYSAKKEWLKELKRISVFYSKKYGDLKKIQSIENYYLSRLTYLAVTERNNSDIKLYRKQMNIDSIKSFCIWIISFLPSSFTYISTQIYNKMKGI